MPRHARSRALALARRHWPILALLALGAGLRAATWRAWYPALFYADSWAYVELAWGSEENILYNPARPSGYSWLIRVLTGGAPPIPERGDAIHNVMAVQHLGGLVVGLLVYVVLLRLGARRWIAALAAAIPLLDARTLALEQHVMTEAFFTLFLTGAAALALLARRHVAALVPAGLLVGTAATVRTAAVFAALALVVFAAVDRRAWRGALVAVVLVSVSVAVPIAVYAAKRQDQTGNYGLSGADGAFLYGRVAELGCDPEDVPERTQVLCDRVPRDRGKGPIYHLYDRTSPLRRTLVFGPESVSPDQNRLLRDHARSVIRDRPLAYLGLVAEEMTRYFRPNAARDRPENTPIRLYSDNALRWDFPIARGRFFGGQVRFDYRYKFGNFMAGYASFAKTPLPLLGLLVLAILAALALAPFRRLRVAHWREVLLFGGMGLSVLVATTATSDALARYVVALQPLIVVAAALAIRDLVAVSRRR